MLNNDTDIDIIGIIGKNAKLGDRELMVFIGVGVFVELDEGSLFEMIGIWDEVGETVVVGEMFLVMICKISLCTCSDGIIGFVLGFEKRN